MDETRPTPSGTVCFGTFKVDLRAREVRKQGIKIKLQEQPFQVLQLLLEHPGEVVTREALRQCIWPSDTFVDFDHGLNNAVKRLREALCDSADTPRYIETLPKRGYRLIVATDSAPATPVNGATATDEKTSGGVVDAADKIENHLAFLNGRILWTLLLVGTITALLLASILALPLGRLRNRLFGNAAASARSPISVELMPLASMHGYEGDPAFSADGTQVAFLELDGSNSGIYTALVGGEKPLRLTANSNDCCPAWSPDRRQVAFLRLFEKEAGIYVISAFGGIERRVYTEPRPLYPGLAWSPDGKFLAFPEDDSQTGESPITLLSLSDFSVRRITSPPPEFRDDTPSFSPDSSQVAFIRGTIAGIVNDVLVVPTSGGEPKRLTFDNRETAGISWTSDARDIVFSSTRGGPVGLWRVPAAGGAPQALAGIGSPTQRPSIPLKGDLLAYQQRVFKDDIARINLSDAEHSRGSPAIVISEKGSKYRPHVSPDGTRISFESNRLGNAEIWTCDSAGRTCEQLTSLHGTAGTSAWSPDGRHLAFEFHPSVCAEIYVMDVPNGVPHLVTTIPGADNLVPTWSRDGDWIYFTSKKGDAPFQLWKVPFKGGPPVQITKTGGLNAVESPDGRFLYYAKYELGGVWKMPVEGGHETRVLNQLPGREWYNWALSRKGIYFLNRDQLPLTKVEFLDFATQKIAHITTLDKSAGWGLDLAPDGKSLLYVDEEFEQANIMLVKNFR